MTTENAVATTLAAPLYALLFPSKKIYMKKNFYFQHSLMSMFDPRMKHLVDNEGLRGLGAYLDYHRKTVNLARTARATGLSPCLLRQQENYLMLP